MLLDLPWQNIRINVHNSGDDTKQNHVWFVSMHLQYIQYTMRIATFDCQELLRINEYWYIHCFQIIRLRKKQDNGHYEIGFSSFHFKTQQIYIEIWFWLIE